MTISKATELNVSATLFFSFAWLSGFPSTSVFAHDFVETISYDKIAISEPWSVSPKYPVQAYTRVSPGNPDLDITVGQTFFQGSLWLYQNVITVVMNSKCPMEPSCSDYSIDAFSAYGVLMGVMMTVDRLLHEGSEMHMVPIVKSGNQYKALDMLSNNNFWWNHKCRE